MVSDTRKQALRLRMLGLRETAAKAAPGAGQSAAARFPDALIPPPGGVVAGYRALGSEIDADPLMIRLAAAGARLALPVMQGEGQPLCFRRWEEGQALERGPHNVHEPGKTAEEVVPDLVLVPLVAIDRRGVRMGYGKGYYDRTLEGLRARGKVRAVGLAFDEQIVDVVPEDPHDQRLDALLTPTQFLSFAS